jgi:hypothetical protein
LSDFWAICFLHGHVGHLWITPMGEVRSQEKADRGTKTNVAPKIVHTLFFLVVGDSGFRRNSHLSYKSSSCKF